jgi:hypothetical protein
MSYSREPIDVGAVEIKKGIGFLEWVLGTNRKHVLKSLKTSMASKCQSSFYDWKTMKYLEPALVASCQTSEC